MRERNRLRTKVFFFCLRFGVRVKTIYERRVTFYHLNSRRVPLRRSQSFRHLLGRFFFQAIFGNNLLGT